MTDLDSCPTLPGRFHWGRVVNLAGAAGLCVSFFMPQIDIFSPVVPVDNTVETYGLFLVAFGLPFLAAILLLPLLVFRAVPRVDDIPGVGKFLAVADCAICLFVVITGLGWIAALVVPDPRLSSEMPAVYTVVAVAVVSLVLAIVALVRSGLPRKAAAAQFALGTSCLAYFAFFIIRGGTVYAGLWLSLAASGILAIGSAIDWFQSVGNCKQS
jgi:hypothetical protein